MAWPSLPDVTTALLDVEAVVPRFATCPLCHTTSQSLTTDALAAGADWQCVRCGRHWSAARLATVAAYDAWVLEREDLLRQRSPSDGQRDTRPKDDAAVVKKHPRQPADAIYTWDNEGGRPS